MPSDLDPAIDRLYGRKCRSRRCSELWNFILARFGLLPKFIFAKREERTVVMRSQESDKRFGINLALILGIPRKFRGELLVQELEGLSMTCRLIPGIDASEVDEYELDRIVNRRAARFLLGREISTGELCCSMVHLDAYKSFLQSGGEWVLILEDDAQMIQDPTTIIKSLPVISSPTLLKLSMPGNQQLLTQIKSSADEKISACGFQKLKFPTDMAHAYLINRAAAELLVRRSLRYRVHYTADWPYLWDGAVQFWQSETSYFDQVGSSLIDINDERFEAIRKPSILPRSVNRFIEAFGDVSGIKSITLFLLGGNGFYYYKARSVRRIQRILMRVRDFFVRELDANRTG